MLWTVTYLLCHFEMWTFPIKIQSIDAILCLHKCFSITELKWNVISCFCDIYFYTTLIFKKVQLKFINCLQKHMVNLLYRKQYICRDWFRRCKIMIVTFTTNNDQVNKKSSKINNCKFCWKKILFKHLKNWLNNSKLINQLFHNVYKPWERFRKKGDGCHMNWQKIPLLIV